MKREIIDGNTAVAKASYKLSEMSFVYPITPASPMAEVCDEMSCCGEKNIFGNVLEVTEMQSEAGAIGALHGSTLAGSVTTTFTSSQGLLLMLPNMFKIAGEMLPTVINVASRSIASHSLNIFCDHSDVMSARQTGFAMLASSSPQEAYDFAVASFLTSMKTRVPFLHFFDGFRTSHQISVVNTFEDAELKQIYPYEKLKEFKQRALSPNNPKQFGTCENGDLFFQGREKSNLQYESLALELEKTFEDIKKLGGKEHHIMEYYGSPNAKFVVCVMASAFNTLKAYVDFAKNKDLGIVKINLYRPFDAKYFLNILPNSVKKIAVLDRTKEQGSLGEPLYLDVCSAVLENDKYIKVFGGRYGLGGKEFSPAMAKAVFDNLTEEKPKNHFAIGIEDDVTFCSLPYDKNFCIESESRDFCIVGIGSDGSVTSAKNITKIVGEENLFVESYFVYDSKKSGGLTRSYISVSKDEINKPYLSNNLEIVAINNAVFLTKYNVAKNLKDGGILLINSKFTETEQIDGYVLDTIKKTLAKKNAKLYSIDANTIAQKNNLKGKISSIMQMAFLKISGLLDYKTAKAKTEEKIRKTLAKKGGDVVCQNLKALEDVENQIVEICVDKKWKDIEPKIQDDDKDEFLRDYLRPVLDFEGDNIPVSKVNMFGENRTGTSKFEKRNVAEFVPKWDYEKCIQCGKCTFVCPHAVLRAKLLTEKQLENAPTTLNCKESLLDKNFKFCLEVSPADCVDCGLCENVCPTNAIRLSKKEEVFDEELENYNFTKNLKSEIPNIPLSPLKTQFMKPYFEFSGACAGCGETPYIKLLTQLFGSGLVIANATGCSSIYGGSAPTCPYAKDDDGFGPAWANSLFEDNAEFGLGIAKANKAKRDNFKAKIEQNLQKFDENMQKTMQNWLKNCENFAICQKIYLELLEQKNTHIQKKPFDCNNDMAHFVFENLDEITPKSVWLVGGDGWAYDIDFGGLDHVFSTGENINILVLDTELYSNTGGQMSKATPMGAVAKFSANGKKTKKKNLALSALTYENVYVAKVCLGADMNQTLKAFEEAQKYDGVSIIIAYAPCINHGIDMSKNLKLEKDAVDCGYWQLFRYNPELLKQNKNPLLIDSKKQNKSFEELLLSQRRFATFFERTADTTLFEKLDKESEDFQNLLNSIRAMFDDKLKK